MKIGAGMWMNANCHATVLVTTRRGTVTAARQAAGARRASRWPRIHSKSGSSWRRSFTAPTAVAARTHA